MDPLDAIANLVFSYAERIDTGDFAGVAELLSEAQITAENSPLRVRGREEILAMYVEGTKRYPDGTPRTKHVTTNLLIELDEGGHAGYCRSYFTVLQAVPGALALQPVIAGRYHDTFELADGGWRFTARHIVVDLLGDLGHHLLGGYRPNG